MLGKSSAQCRILLQGLSDRLNQACALVQPVGDRFRKRGLIVVDERSIEAKELVVEIKLEFEILLGEMEVPDYERRATEVEQYAFYPFIRDANTDFTLDPNSEQCHEWYSQLIVAEQDIAYGIDSLENF